MERIGFLSFGHWHPQTGTRSAGEVLHQTIELAEVAEGMGLDGAYVRVHHFARQLASPFPLLSAIAARTRRIEIGTGVIDMRYENPLYMAETAAAADLISAGRLQLGVSRGSPEQVIEGFRHFGYAPEPGETDADLGRRHTLAFLEALAGEGFAEPNPHPMFPNPPGLLGIEPHAPGLRDRIWWGAGSRATAAWAAREGMNLQSSTLVAHESDQPFHVAQYEQIQGYREAWAAAGHLRTPRVSVSRSILPITTDRDRMYFGGRSRDGVDQIGQLEDVRAIFGRTYSGEPGRIVEELLEDRAVADADTLLITVPNQLGVAYNAHLIGTILAEVAPALGWVHPDARVPAPA